MKKTETIYFYHARLYYLYHICNHSDYLCGISGIYQLYRYGKGRFVGFENFIRIFNDERFTPAFLIL